MIEYPFDRSDDIEIPIRNGFQNIFKYREECPCMTRGPKPKVVRLINEYDLGDFGDELEQRWTDADDRDSLRKLARDVNLRLLESALAEMDEPRLDGELKNLYQLLTDDDRSSGAHIQARNTLQQQGIDVDQLKEDFVSHQAIYTYLTKYRDVESPDETPSKQEQLDQRQNTIQRLRTRLTTVTETSLTELANADHLTLGEFKVLVTVRIQCTDCNTWISIADLFANRGCECSPVDHN